jgi:hypothetical protein
MAAGENGHLDREVTIGVPDGAERDEMADREARRGSELPSRRDLRPFPGTDRSARELPETREETDRSSTLDEPSTVVGENDDRGP